MRLIGHLHAAAALLFAAGGAMGQGAAPLPSYSKSPAEWATLAPTGGLGGSNNPNVQVITLLGDPAKPGVYVQLLKVAPHARIAPHFHNGDRVASVLKGTWMFGYGPNFDPNALRTLPPGSVYTEPSGAPHFAMTGDEAVVVEVTGNGPTDTHYVNPADDPLKPAKR